MDEIITIVDENDNVIGEGKRSEVINSGKYYRSSRVLILNNEGEFLVQKRTEKKDLYPGFWDIGVVGAIPKDESYAATASRELKEEVGVDVPKEQIELNFCFKLKNKIENNNSFCSVYQIVNEGPFKLQKEEVSEVKFLKKEKVIELIKKEKFHPVGKTAFLKFLELSE